MGNFFSFLFCLVAVVRSGPFSSNLAAARTRTTTVVESLSAISSDHEDLSRPGVGELKDSIGTALKYRSVAVDKNRWLFSVWSVDFSNLASTLFKKIC